MASGNLYKYISEESKIETGRFKMDADGSRRTVAEVSPSEKKIRRILQA